MKSRLMILEICGIFLFSMNMHGQYRIDPAVQNNACLLTGNLQYDLSTDIESGSNADSSVIERKVVKKRFYSPMRAGLFSLVIPGAGQFYTKSYWQSAAFFGTEVLMWVLYATYENRGDRKTAEFQNYANEHWSVVNYSVWINTYFPDPDNPSTPRITINPDQSLKPWERVGWGELNVCEEAIGGQPNTGFTHKLAPYNDQQYYEMIGKYSQFGGGWDDASGFTKEDVNANKGVGNLSPRFLAYSKMRGEANSYYNIGTTVSYIIVANHVLSALEAAWNASKKNHRIKLQGHIESRRIDQNFVEFVPTLHLEYEL